MRKKIRDFCKERLKSDYVVIILLLFVIVGFGVYIKSEQEKYARNTENDYNLAFYEVNQYVQRIENYLAKATITKSAKHGIETLTEIWKDANLAVTHLSRLPMNQGELASTSKFLNQVSDYCYSLSRKNINMEDLTDEDLSNLKEMHQYSLDLENSLNQLMEELNTGIVSWSDFTTQTELAYTKQVDNISFSNIDDNFNEYAGLIYDGAFSDHVEKMEKKGLTGEEIDEETAKQNAIAFIGPDKVEKITSNGLIENGNIIVYDFSVKLHNIEDEGSISIAKKGGHIVFMNIQRDVQEEKISREQANEIGKTFLSEKGFAPMQETYYMQEYGTITVNYAYNQDGVIVYPDLVKVKIALDNGEILGIEAMGYLNAHEQREIPEAKISIEEAKSNLNKELEILSEGMAIIPTEWKTEIFCYEFKGKVEETEFLVYINAQTGDEENILVILETPNGTLTM